MRWFKNENLRVGFNSFLYWGPEYQPRDRDLPVWDVEDFALSHPTQLAKELVGHDSWLLFVNAAETHAPYLASEALTEEMRALAHIRNGKGRLGPDFRELMAQLHASQVRALEIADGRLARLFAALPGPFDYLVTADHGEAFGEDGLWGHVVAHRMVTTVPLWEGTYARN